MKKLEKLKELGTIEAITGGRNGYPSPEIGLAFIPNNKNDLEEAQKLIPNSRLYEFHKRDGWMMLELNIEIHGIENYNLSGLDFGDNYETIDVEKEEDIKDIVLWRAGYKSWGYNSWEEMEREEEMRTEDIESMKTQAKELESCLEVGVNLLHNGIWETTLSELGYSHDTHNYMLGLFIDNDTEEGLEIWEEEYS